MTNAEIARVFSQLATMLEMDGANPFRVRAYREAARVMGEQAEPAAALAAQEGRLEEIAGIGKDLAQKIRELVERGSFQVFDEMRAKYPLEVVALTELQGVGPKRVKILFDQLHVKNHDDLERAAREGKLRDLPGFGEVMEQKVLKALSTASQYSGRMLLAGAWQIAHALAERVRKLRGVESVELAGSFRRRRETIGDLDVLATGGDSEAVMGAFTGHPDVAEILGRGETKSSVRLKNGLQVDLRLVPPESFGAAMLYFTGSKEHNIELRKIAIDKGYSLNEYGLSRGEKLIAGRTEEEVYRALGMSWIPPELREARGEIGQAIKGTLPELIEERDLRADLHMHTDRTDGRESLETMVRAARERGYQYCAITEHSQAIAMAGGFDEARVRRSVEEMAAVRRQVPGIEVLHGLEVDILGDGRLDLADDALALLDWVIVSLHSRLEQPGPAITDRVLRALSHPAVHAMAHPTARLIGTRPPAALDLERVFERAAERGVAMEINAQPDRTDLSDVNARLARDRGVKIVIDTDAHSVPQLDNVRYGLFAARRAGLIRDDVLNALPYERFRKAVRRGPPGKQAAVPGPKEEAAEAHDRPRGAGAKAAAKRAATDRAGKRAVAPGRKPRGGSQTARRRADERAEPAREATGGRRAKASARAKASRKRPASRGSGRKGR